MADYSNIPTGLNITSQIPLDKKEQVENEATLAYLGVGDNLAYTYYENMFILAREENKIYQWRERAVGEIIAGLRPLDFTYPNGLPITNGIDYSGRIFNFFLVDYTQYIEPVEYSASSLTTGLTEAKIYKETTINSPTDIEFKFRTVYNEDGTIEIQENEQGVKINAVQNNNITVTNNLDIEGDGSELNPYIIDTVNKQKTISDFPYTITNNDNNYTIFINNDTADISILVNEVLMDGITVAFIRLGSGNVVFNYGTGLPILNTTYGTKIRVQFGWCLLEKYKDTTNYYLLGDLTTI